MTMKKVKWAEWEDSIIREFYQPERKSAGIAECVARLPSRTRDAIICRASALGVALPQHDAVSRFFRRIQITPGCWLWKGGTDRAGYGAYKWAGKKMGAHRASYYIHFETIADGLMVCHRCDNPLCVNPDHLFLGTNQDNMQDMVSKGRGKQIYGFSGQAKLTDADVAEIRSLNLRHVDIAARLGISPTYVSHIRAGRCRTKSKGDAAC